MTEEDAYKRDPNAEKVPGSEYEPTPQQAYSIGYDGLGNKMTDEKEAYEERAAIMEYDGGMSRKEAERKAMEWIREMRNERGL